jgi:hypothetical protein
MNLNQFIDRDRPGRMIAQGGFTSHAQACGRVDGEHVLFLLLQGRQTHVRAHWASFHERDLAHYNRLAGKDVYLKPNPTAVLPSGAGIEMAIVHRGLAPGQIPDGATHLFTGEGTSPWKNARSFPRAFFTFGPPHFGLMFQAAMPAPMLSHWEQVLWNLGLATGLIHEVEDTWNVRLWLVRIDTQRWLRAMSGRHHRFTYEEERTKQDHG